MSGFNFDVITLFPKAFELINGNEKKERNLLIFVNPCSGTKTSKDTYSKCVSFGIFFKHLTFNIYF